MTAARTSPGSAQARLYESYASTHAGVGDGRAAALVYRRDIRPHLLRPGEPARVLDIGCGQGDLVRLMLADGLDAFGVDVSPEQVRLARDSGLVRVLEGDFHDRLHAEAGGWDAVVATDVLEHLATDDLLRTFESVLHALRPGGVFVARVPNATSPVGGHIMYGDITHRTWFTPRSVAQLAAVAGFGSVACFACPPPVHGVLSLIRAAAWRLVSAGYKGALIVETGQLRNHIVTQNLTFVARATGADGARRVGSG
ncbi:class I SAM-dependent methyltransferase [Plantactinospora siamensis]|uniref:Class I SAM-dependent methyltransferase n=1 Tax=Plantactinospora siamensis TaxID=555372 RepID=A0ABV6P0N4_9ACTN